MLFLEKSFYLYGNWAMVRKFENYAVIFYYGRVEIEINIRLSYHPNQT